ncbi:hypothetical protein ACLB2K_039170 [Fragaria x ananassa]
MKGGGGGGSKPREEEQDGMSVHSPCKAPPSSASSLPKEQSQVELELRLLEALEIYPPVKLQGSFDRNFSSDEVLQLLDRFYNLEMLVFTSLRTGTTGFKFKVFTLGGTSNTWKDVADIDYEDLGLVPHQLNFCAHYLCIHGAIHWMQQFYCKNRPVLLAFDVVEERFRVIPFPQDSKNKRRNYRVIEVNGCFAVFDLEVDACERAMNFWILKDYQNEVWVREKNHVSCSMVQFGIPPSCLLNPHRRDPS